MGFVKDRLKSVRYATRGIITMITLEHNAWVHTLATLTVAVVGLICKFNRWEWCWIILAVVAVWTAEALNTAFEFLTDLASPEFHPLAEKAKNVAAGAVLITAMGAVLVGLIILVPHIYSWFK